MKDPYLKTAKDKIVAFSTFLGEKKWFGGDNVRLCVPSLINCCMNEDIKSCY